MWCFCGFLDASRLRRCSAQFALLASFVCRLHKHPLYPSHLFLSFCRSLTRLWVFLFPPLALSCLARLLHQISSSVPLLIYIFLRLLSSPPHLLQHISRSLSNSPHPAPLPSLSSCSSSLFLFSPPAALKGISSFPLQVAFISSFCSPFLSMEPAGVFWICGQDLLFGGFRMNHVCTQIRNIYS